MNKICICKYTFNLCEENLEAIVVLTINYFKIFQDVFLNQNTLTKDINY